MSNRMAQNTAIAAICCGFWLVAGCATIDTVLPATPAAAAPASLASAASNTSVPAPLPPSLRDPLAARGGRPVPVSDRIFSASRQTVEATFTRLRGRIHKPLVEQWNQWAAQNLRDGDIVFMRSEDNYVLGVIDFSKLTQDVTASPFTHIGIVAMEEGQAYVYDTDTSGPDRTPFGLLMLHPGVTGVAIKRLRPAYQPYVPGALAYCRSVVETKIPFDHKLKLDNDRLYCAEMVELAYRTAGLELSRPIRWDALPGIAAHAMSVRAIGLVNGNRPDDYAIIPGNDEIGLWSSPALELVLSLTDCDTPPPPRAAASQPVARWPG